MSRWAEIAAAARPEVLRVGYFGSYARGDWGVGSDVDLIVIVADSKLPFERRGTEWDVSGLPVPADLFIYTRSEWDNLVAQEGFQRTADRETVWVYRAV